MVVGYGAQAGNLSGCAACFSDADDGAIVNASRSLTYAWPEQPGSEDDVVATIRANTERMGSDLVAALMSRQGVAEPLSR